MFPFKSHRRYFSLLGSVLIFLLAVLPGPASISYFQVPTIPFVWDSVQSNTRSIRDTLSENVIHQAQTAEGVPLFYAQDIVTGVCFDNKCRPLDLTVYWNITGRYLGFDIPDGEFLSRYDHEPFKPEDYERLHALMADPQLPFRNIAFEELIQQSAVDTDSIDGVSGATSKSLSAYVVEGAAYTTYTLWNIIYGPAQETVRRITEQEMTPALLTLILQSPSSQDRIWGLRRIDGATKLTPEVENALLTIIGGEDFSPAYLAIDRLQPGHLRSESLQLGLFSNYQYQEVNHSLKKLIIEKLKEAPEISAEVIRRSREELAELNGQQLGQLLELYDRHSIHDLPTGHAVAKLLNKDNRFIAGKAYKYLVSLPEKDETIIRALDKYHSADK